MKQAAARFQSVVNKGSKAWLTERCTYDYPRRESLDPHHGVDAVWVKFTSCFPIVGSILFYEPILRDSLQYLLNELAEDGVRWIDFRLAFVSKCIPRVGGNQWKDTRNFSAFLAMKSRSFSQPKLDKIFGVAGLLYRLR